MMLRTFDLAVKGAANKSAQGIALGGVGIAVGVTRRDRAALGAGLPTPPACPTDRSPALIADPGLEVFVLDKLTPNEGEFLLRAEALTR